MTRRRFARAAPRGSLSGLLSMAEIAADGAMKIAGFLIEANPADPKRQETANHIEAAIRSLRSAHELIVNTREGKSLPPAA